MRMDTLKNRPYLNCFALNVIDFWLIDLSREFVLTVNQIKLLGTNVMIAKKPMRLLNLSILFVFYVKKMLS